MPSGAIEEQHGVRAVCDMAADLVEMQLHGRSIGVRQGEGGSFAARRANGAEQAGALVTLVGRLARSCATPCPSPHDAVRREIDSLDQFLVLLTLADAGFILPPDLHRRCLGSIGQMRF